MGSGAALRAMTGVVTLVCWTLTFYKLRDLVRDPRNPSLRSLWLAITAITLAMTLQPLASSLDGAIGMLDTGRVLANCLTLVGGAGAQAFLLYLTAHDEPVRRKVRLRYLLVAGGVVALVAWFITTPKPYRPDDPYVTGGEYAHNGEVAGYTYLYLLLLAWPLVECGILAARYATIAARPLLRVGLRMITAGCVIAGGYVVLKVIQGQVTPGDAAASAVGTSIALCFTSSVLIILIGSTLPSWGQRLKLDLLWDNAADLRAYRRLGPLWSDTIRVNPGIALFSDPPGLQGRLQVAREARLRLARRVVEINDGLVEVHPYTRSAVADTAPNSAGPNDTERNDPDRAAAAIADAIAGYLQQRPITPEPDRYPLTRRSADAETTADELAWLLAVADAYRHRHPLPTPTQPPTSAERTGPSPS